MPSYDRAITIFSPDGHLFQVEYAQEAVKKGSTAVGVKGENSVVIAVEKKSSPVLQDERTIKKIHQIDSHVVLAFAGLNADARVLVDRARVECQSHRLSRSDPVTLKYITKHIASVKQKFTQSNGRRPFGVSILLAGIDADGEPQLFQTEPSGIYNEWKANATGRGQKTVREYLEKHYDESDLSSEDGTIRLAVAALSEVIQSGASNLEVAVMSKPKGKELKYRILPNEELETICQGFR